MKSKVFWGILSTILLILAFPPIRWWPLAFFFPMAFLMTIHGTTPKWSFLLPFFIGSVFFGVHLFWILFLEVPHQIKMLLILGFFLLVLYEALYFAVFGFFSSILSKKSVLSIPSLWVIIEYIRGYGTLGFPWVPLWYSQIKNLSFARWASVVGPYGLSFLIFFTGTLLFLFFEAFKKKRRFIYLFSALAFFLIFELTGNVLPLLKPVGALKVAIFQPNVVPEYIGEDEWPRLSLKYKELSSELKDDVDLMIFPESSIPGFYRISKRAQKLFTEIAKKHAAPTLIGSADFEPKDTGYLYFNGALLIDTAGVIIDSYRKTHLVPFGEWLPFEDRIKFLQRIELGQGNYTPGKSYSPIFLKGKLMGILICFESIFPEISREEVKKGAQVLINMTSDGWFGRSLGPVEHFELARFRAIETNRELVRCARTGISAIINPKGEVVKSIGLFKDGLLTHKVLLYKDKTPYVKYGDWVLLIAILNLLGIGVYNALRKK